MTWLGRARLLRWGAGGCRHQGLGCGLPVQGFGFKSSELEVQPFFWKAWGFTGGRTFVADGGNTATKNRESHG